MCIYIYIYICAYQSAQATEPQEASACPPQQANPTLPTMEYYILSDNADRSKRVIHSSVLGRTHAFRSFEVLFGGLRLGGIGSIAEGLEVRGLLCR